MSKVIIIIVEDNCRRTRIVNPVSVSALLLFRTLAATYQHLSRACMKITLTNSKEDRTKDVKLCAKKAQACKFAGRRLRRARLTDRSIGAFETSIEGGTTTCSARSTFQRGIKRDERQFNGYSRGFSREINRPRDDLEDLNF